MNRKLLIGIIVVLVLLLAGLSAMLVLGNNNANQTNNNRGDTSTENTDDKDVESEAPEMPVQEGVITGSLTYPSEAIPDDIVIHAYNLETRQDFFVRDHIGGEEYQYGVGFKINVPPGRYHVYGVRTSDPGQRAYYNEFVKCGMKTECSDRSNIEVTVEAGEEAKGVVVGDWYNT